MSMRGTMPPRMSRKPGALMSASWKMRSPSVIIPKSCPLLTTGAPEIRASAKSRIASSTVLSGSKVGQSVCMISLTLSSLMSCWSTPYVSLDVQLYILLILLQPFTAHGPSAFPSLLQVFGPLWSYYDHRLTGLYHYVYHDGKRRGMDSNHRRDCLTRLATGRI